VPNSEESEESDDVESDTESVDEVENLTEDIHNEREWCETEVSGSQSHNFRPWSSWVILYVMQMLPSVVCWPHTTPSSNVPLNDSPLIVNIIGSTHSAVFTP